MPAKLLRLRALEPLAPTVLLPLVGDDSDPGAGLSLDPDEVTPPDGDEVTPPALDSARGDT